MGWEDLRRLLAAWGPDAPVSGQSILDHIERDARLRLHSAQSFRRDVFLKERVQSGMQLRADGWQRVAAVGEWGHMLLVGGEARRIRGHGGTAWSVAIHLKETAGTRGVDVCTVS